MRLPVLFLSGVDAYEIARVPGISAVPHDDNLRYFDVLIDGPGQSPYEGSCGFLLTLQRVILTRDIQVVNSSSSSSCQMTIL